LKKGARGCTALLGEGRTDARRRPAAQAAGQASLLSSANPAATQGPTTAPTRAQEFIAAAINRQDALNAKMLAEVFDKLDDDDDGEIGARALSCALQVGPGHEILGLDCVVMRGCRGRAIYKEALLWDGLCMWHRWTAAMGQCHTPQGVCAALRASPGAGARRAHEV